MQIQTDPIEGQLRESCKITPAKWAVVLEYRRSVWHLHQQVGLTKSAQTLVEKLILAPQISAWMTGGLKTGRIRSRGLDNQQKNLRCDRVFLVPKTTVQMVILVGSDQLDSKDRSIFRIVARGLPGAQVLAPDLERILTETLREITSEITYDLPSVLQRILGALTHILDSQAIAIGLRYGNQIRVQAVRGYEIEPKTRSMDLDHYPRLIDLLSGPQAERIYSISQTERCPLLPKFEEGVWVGIPLIIGTRSIGFICFADQEVSSFKPSKIETATQIIAHLAPSIEKAVVFDDISQYLEKLVILNELAATVAISTDASEVAKRILRRLQRIFKTELVALLMVDPTGETMYEFGNHGSPEQQFKIPVDQSLAGYVVEIGQPIRLNNVKDAPRYFGSNPGVVSELAVPLKYRERIIGVMNLESTLPGAFSEQDEQLLVVIASHLAGFIENVRLHEETRRRAEKLALLHQISEKIVGLVDISEIAQTVAKTIADRLEPATVVVILADSALQTLRVAGVGGRGAKKIRIGFSNPANRGITGIVYQTGQSRLANDTTQDPDYVDYSGWQAGSELCVPLRSDAQVIGVIDIERVSKNSFSQNDLLLLEAVAGLVSSVMTSAMRYQELQINYRHLEAARETAIDISADLTLGTVLQRVAHRAKALLGAKGVELGFVNQDKKVVEVKLSENPWGEFIRGEEIPFSNGVAGLMAIDGKSYRVANYSTWENRLVFRGSPPFSSVAGVPLIYQGSIIGTLTVSNDEIGVNFAPEDLQLLELLAPQIAASVHNAKLYQELQESIDAKRLASKRLIQSARLAAVGEMAAGVAHELNNPLTTITGFVELALDEIPAENPSHADLELVLRESLRAKEVVRRLLDFSRPLEGFRIRSDINDMISEVIAIIQHLAHTTGVELRMELWNELPWMQVDRNQIKQVFLNLFQNALQAMPNGGVLLIQTSLRIQDASEWVTVQVHDTGEGIQPENLQRIFEPFFTTRPPGKGSGLGLAVSYGIIQDHDGMIEVESTPNTGSVFTIWLPVQSNRVMI
jgi:signal transduction histidine kinase